jgi:AraC-like DNA-binding protein
VTAKKIDALAAVIERHAPTDGLHETRIDSVDLFRQSAPTEWATALYEPSLVIVARGRKEVRIADVTYRYDPANYVLASVDLPVSCRVATASVSAPYLALRIRIDPLVVGDLLADSAATRTPSAPSRAFVVTPVEPPLLDAVSRIVSLLDEPDDIPVLAPLVLREITYRVLTGPQRARLQQTVAAGAPAERITRAIAWIKDHMVEAIGVDGLARKVGLGLSAFHLHFKTVTGTTPLQFQKRLRLLEARRLIVAAGLTAAEAAIHVGYVSPSQFSREYRRAFGAPPRQDAATLRGEVQGVSV